VRDQLAAERGCVTLRRCVATLPSALSDAVASTGSPTTRPATPTSPARVAANAPAGHRHKPPRSSATAPTVHDPLAELYEVILGTGMRRGEALALHWADVDLDARMLSSQVPLAITSKTMRHSTLSTTTEIYGHLLRHAARQAVDAIDIALTTAENDPPAA
jgi:integrase